jgi:3-dehydroquinate dehydratase-1
MTAQADFAAKSPTASGRAAVCVPLVATTGEALLAEVKRVVALQPDLIEWRLDTLQVVRDEGERSLETIPLLWLDLQECLGTIPLILTLRSQSEGGQAGDMPDSTRVSALLALARMIKPRFLDVELSVHPLDFSRARTRCDELGIRLIGSSHDFSGTASYEELLETFRRASRAGADIAKVAVMPKDFDDVLRMMAATREADSELQIPVVGISMGELGVASRIFASECRSVMTFVSGHEASAPGQVTLEHYRAIHSMLQS